MNSATYETKSLLDIPKSFRGSLLNLLSTLLTVVYWCTLLPLPTVVIVSPPFPLFFRRMQLCLQALGSGDGFQGWLISKAHVLTILSLRLKYRRERLRHSACSTQPTPTTSEPKLLQCYFVTRHVRQTDEEWELIREATHHAKFC